MVYGGYMVGICGVYGGYMGGIWGTWWVYGVYVGYMGIWWVYGGYMGYIATLSVGQQILSSSCVVSCKSFADDILGGRGGRGEGEGWELVPMMIIALWGCHL